MKKKIKNYDELLEDVFMLGATVVTNCGNPDALIHIMQGIGGFVFGSALAVGKDREKALADSAKVSTAVTECLLEVMSKHQLDITLTDVLVSMTGNEDDREELSLILTEDIRCITKDLALIYVNEGLDALKVVVRNSKEILKKDVG